MITRRKFLTLSCAAILAGASLTLDGCSGSNSSESSSLKGAKVGDVVKLGTYPQDSKGTKEPIEWVVIQQDSEGRLLLTTSKVLDCKPYNDTDKSDPGWDNINSCSLKKWLKNDFTQTAFTDAERQKIVETSLMSEGVCDSYFNDTRCEPTDYAVAQGVYVDEKNGFCMYWVQGEINAVYFSHPQFEHIMGGEGYKQTYDNFGVRPTVLIEP